MGEKLRVRQCRETRGYEKSLDRQNLRRMLPECFGLGELCPKHTSTYSLIILFHHLLTFRIRIKNTIYVPLHKSQFYSSTTIAYQLQYI